ncbi:GIY-YIG nuclease family protein [Tautonia plasticadhaerens]|uniref:GIY-YIG nuclease family protein n=1 Tax=Tautonia plasticadhaerens TaxID=2527974 RepID=UPI0011A27614|nr:GIY-YIG nuclease family protein [Tautonia plasticadhaerens]
MGRNNVSPDVRHRPPANSITIYKMTCRKSKRVYIGKAKDLDKRIIGHFQSLMLNGHPNSLIQVDFWLFGLASFEFKPLLVVPAECATEFESRVIKAFALKAHMYNMTGVGNNRELSARAFGWHGRIAHMESKIARQKKRPKQEP